MMGRSHAPFAALGYLMMEPMSYMEINVGSATLSGNELGITTGIIATLFGLATFLLPNKSSSKTMAVSESYRLLYVAIMMVTIVLALLTIALFARLYFPDTLPDTAAERLVWMAVAAGYGVIPDIDEPNSTVSRVFAPVSQWLSAFIRDISGGHRKATHSWILVVIGLILAIVAQSITAVAVFMFIIAYILSLRLLLPTSISNGFQIPLLAIGVGVPVFIVMGSFSVAPLLLAVPVGIILHDIGDWMTNSGIPFAYPIKKKFTARLFSTGGSFETFVVQPGMIAGLAIYIFFYIVSPSLSGEAPAGVPDVGKTEFGIEKFIKN